MSERTLEQLERDRAWRGRREKSFWGDVLEAQKRVRERELRESRREARRAALARDTRLQTLSAWDRLVYWGVADLMGSASETMLVSRLRKQGHESLTRATLLVALRRLKARGLVTDQVEQRQGHGVGYSVRLWSTTPVPGAPEG